ncbi:MAG: hypothetical protein V3R17_02690, partial [Hyphomicrobium sp.]
ARKHPVRAAMAELRAEAVRTGGLTLAKAIARAGDFAERAAQDHAWARRRARRQFPFCSCHNACSARPMPSGGASRFNEALNVLKSMSSR